MQRHNEIEKTEVFAMIITFIGLITSWMLIKMLNSIVVNFLDLTVDS